MPTTPPSLPATATTQWQHSLFFIVQIRARPFGASLFCACGSRISVSYPAHLRWYKVNPIPVSARTIKDKNKEYMKWLTLDWIRDHSRLLKDEAENDILELYGDDAEQTVLNICNRSYEDIMETYGEVPKPLFVAALMLVEVAYTHRSPDTNQQLYLIPYTFDMKVKPYIKLANDNNNQGYGCKNL